MDLPDERAKLICIVQEMINADNELITKIQDTNREREQLLLKLLVYGEEKEYVEEICTYCGQKRGTLSHACVEQVKEISKTMTDCKSEVVKTMGPKCGDCGLSYLFSTRYGYTKHVCGQMPIPINKKRELDIPATMENMGWGTHSTNLPVYKETKPEWEHRVGCDDEHRSRYGCSCERDALGDDEYFKWHTAIIGGTEQ